MEEKCAISRSLAYFFIERLHAPLLLTLGSELLQTVFGAAIADGSSSRLITFAATPEALTTAVSQSVGLRAVGFSGGVTLSRRPRVRATGRGRDVGVSGFSALFFPPVPEKQLFELGGGLRGV